MNATVLRVLLFAMIFVSVSTVFSQTQPIESDEQSSSVFEGNTDNSDNERKTWKDRIVVGGSLGATFGSSTYVEVSPIVGYKVTDKFTAGLGFSYQYYKVNYNVFTIDDYSMSVYGPRIFAQHDIIYGLFAHAEYEMMKYNFKYEDPLFGEYTGQVPALFGGLGYNYAIGDKAKFQLTVLYDFLNGPNSLYYSPWVFRMGFSTGF